MQDLYLYLHTGELPGVGSLGRGQFLLMKAQNQAFLSSLPFPLSFIVSWQIGRAFAPLLFLRHDLEGSHKPCNCCVGFRTPICILEEAERSASCVFIYGYAGSVICSGLPWHKERGGQLFECRRRGTGTD